MDVSAKVASATGAVGVTTPLNVILVWALGKHSVPPEVAVSFATLLSTAAAGLTGYLVKEKILPPDVLQPPPLAPAQPGAQP